VSENGYRESDCSSRNCEKSILALDMIMQS
jgi:hypothetical protein